MRGRGGGDEGEGMRGRGGGIVNKVSPSLFNGQNFAPLRYITI